MAYCEYGKEPIVFKSITKGKIAKEKSGTYGWSWDYIFIPDGEEKTMGNFPDDVLEEFYTPEKQIQYGVVGIRFEII